MQLYRNIKGLGRCADGPPSQVGFVAAPPQAAADAIVVSAASHGVKSCRREPEPPGM
jgi:hypothetical protein